MYNKSFSVCRVFWLMLRLPSSPCGSGDVVPVQFDDIVVAVSAHQRVPVNACLKSHYRARYKHTLSLLHTTVVLIKPRAKLFGSHRPHRPSSLSANVHPSMQNTGSKRCRICLNDQITTIQQSFPHVQTLKQTAAFPPLLYQIVLANQMRINEKFTYRITLTWDRCEHSSSFFQNFAEDLSPLRSAVHFTCFCRTQLCCSLTHVDGYNMRKSACCRGTPERTPSRSLCISSLSVYSMCDSPL